MKSIFVFTAGNPGARSHLEASIMHPIPRNKVFDTFEDRYHQELLRIEEEGNGFYAWGAEPGPRNEPNWENIQQGDCVLCEYENKYHYVSKALGKYNNEKFAKEVWGINSKTGNTWQYMYFLQKPISIDIPVSRFEDYLSSGYRGFTRIPDEKISNIVKDYGSLDSFVNKEILKITDESATEQREFLNVMRRYMEMGIVFRSATRGARYFIESVDDSGCIVERIDAEESERCTISGYRNKQEILKSNGGKYRFNDFDGTAAKRATYLQALPFGLSPNHEEILDLSDERRALEVLCDIVRNLRVDATSGMPRLYKPVMIACVLEGMEHGELNANNIQFDWIAPKFIAKMRTLGEEVSEIQAATAFYHLTSDMFWLLSFRDPRQVIDTGTPSPRALRDRVSHAIIKDTFWRPLQDSSGRKEVLSALAETWWPRRFWWVNQGKTYAQERDGGFIWAPKENDQGQQFFHWTNVSAVKRGNIIFHYSNNEIQAVSIASSDGHEASRPDEIPNNLWTSEGWRAELKYYELTKPVALGAVAQKILDLKLDKGPINSTGGVNQGYLYKLNQEGARRIAQELDLDGLPEGIRNIFHPFSIGEPKMEPFTAEKRSEKATELFKDIEGTGFIFQPWHIAAYVTALRTKPFVILAGVSGTGKSKLPKLIAGATGGKVHLIPVRPDWTDSSDVLGYLDLRGQFKPGALLEFAQEASNDPTKHFVCIVDEMNLARVEHYFAEILSCIEDRHPSSHGGFESDPLLTFKLKEDDSSWANQGLPHNLAIVGTVNMDESTYGFSRKVLDRAFTIELSDLELSSWKESKHNELIKRNWPIRAWYPRAIQLGGLSELNDKESGIINKVIKTLNEINTFLLQAQLQVAYRIRDEIALFVLHAQEIKSLFTTLEDDTVDPLDLAIQMKVLPRIAGGSNAIRRTLLHLLGWSRVGKEFKDEEEARDTLAQWEAEGRLSVLSDALYPRTAARLCLMWDRLLNEGFTSFWL